MRERLIVCDFCFFSLSFRSCSGPIFVIESWVRLTLSIPPALLVMNHSYIWPWRVERALGRAWFTFLRRRLETLSGIGHKNCLSTCCKNNNNWPVEGYTVGQSTDHSLVRNALFGDSRFVMRFSLSSLYNWLGTGGVCVRDSKCALWTVLALYYFRSLATENTHDTVDGCNTKCDSSNWRLTHCTLTDQ